MKKQWWVTGLYWLLLGINPLNAFHKVPSVSDLLANHPTFPAGFKDKKFNDGDTENSVREEAKTTYVLSPKKTFNSVKSFLSFLKSIGADDATMKDVPFTKKSPRLTQEKYFVTITRAYLYTFSIEEDNDIHLIFGDNKTSVNSNNTMNGEVSGLSVLFLKHQKQIRKIRYKAVRILEGYAKCNSTTDEPLFIPIKISGSVFYDYQHKSRPAKCGCCAASGTAWEIHPIYNLDILEE